MSPRRKLERRLFGWTALIMKIRFFFLLPLLISLVPAAPSLAAGDRFALVIGNAKYPDADAPLKEPINDARDVADELKRDGFSVEIGENLTGDGMRRAFDKLYAKIKPGSVALVFFSGFGIQSARQSYLLPSRSMHRSGPNPTCAATGSASRPCLASSTRAAPASRSR